jgi:mRNA interferase MazF
MGETPGVKVPKRGELYLVNFDSTIGSEMQKTRPALIIQNDIANAHSPVTIVAAITTYNGGKLYPTEVEIEAPAGGLDRDSVILLNQVRTIDKQRLIRRIGSLDAHSMVQVAEALRLSLGLLEP